MKAHSSFYSTLSTNITREVCRYLSINLLVPCINLSTLKLIDLETGFTTTSQLSVIFSMASVFCFCSDRTLLCLGNHPPATNAWTLDVLTASLSEVAPMTTARGWPGALYYGQFVYLFGGNTDLPLHSCEKFDIQRKEWTSVGDMHSAKVAFSPCVHEKEVFLLSMLSVQTQIEVFTPACEVFRVLPVALRAGELGSVSFFQGDTIVMITFSRREFRWKLGTTEVSEKESNNSDPTSAVSNIMPLTVENSVYWVNYYTGKLVQLDMLTNLLH